MGLDQYLYEIVWTGDDLKVELSKPSQGTTQGAIQEVGYWRKAWMIHDWFSRNCEGTVTNCGYTRISSDKLQELKNLCGKVLAVCTKKQKEYLKDLTKGDPTLNSRQCKIIEEELYPGSANFEPLWEIYHTYEILRDLKIEGRTFLYWPWW